VCPDAAGMRVAPAADVVAVLICGINGSGSGPAQPVLRSVIPGHGQSPRARNP
jgi:hypothetical protein